MSISNVCYNVKYRYVDKHYNMKEELRKDDKEVLTFQEEGLLNAFSKKADEFWEEIDRKGKDKFWEDWEGKEEKKPTFEQVPETESEFHKGVTFQEFIQKEYPDPQWVVQDLFASRTVNMISALSSSGKTWMSLAVALSVAQGIPLFGHFETTKQGVLIVNEEDSERQLQGNIKELTKEKDINIYLHINHEIKFEEHTEQIIQEMENKKLSFVIFDSLTRLHNREEKDSKEMNKVYDYLKRFIQRGFTVLLIHHNRKPDRYAGKIKDRFSLANEVRGSTVIYNSIDSCIHLEPKEEEGERFVVATQIKQRARIKELLNPFKVMFRKSETDVQLLYGGEYDDQGNKKEQARAFIWEEFIINPNEKRSVKDFMLLAGDRFGRNSILYAIKELEGVGDINSDTRGHLQIPNEDGKLTNEKLYWKTEKYNEDDGLQ